MQFSFSITVEVDRESGKFASREEIRDAIREALESADPGEVFGVGADGDSTYTVTDWSVAE